MRLLLKLSFFLMLLLYSCQQSETDVMLEEFHANGKISVRVFEPNYKGQQRVLNFDNNGTLTHEFYKKNGQYDSLMIAYENGKKHKEFQVNSNGELSGRVIFFNTEGEISEEFYWKNGKRNGWHLFYDESGDTTRIYYRVEDQVLYFRQRKEQNWIDGFFPLIRAERDSAKVGEALVWQIELPLPDSLFNISGLRIGAIEWQDDALFALPETGINLEIQQNYVQISSLPAKLSIRHNNAKRGSYIFQIIDDKAEKQNNPFYKKNFVFYH